MEGASRHVDPDIGIGGGRRIGLARACREAREARADAVRGRRVERLDPCQRLVGIAAGDEVARAGMALARRRHDQSPRAAASTSSTWPGTLTLRQMPRMTPLASTRNVARSMPMYLRPYMLFSTQVP